MAVTGYSLSKEDNDTIAFGDRFDVKRCPGCVNISDKWASMPEGVRIQTRSFDLSSTYDGVAIASRRFRKFVRENGITGVVFRELPSDPLFFQVLATRVVKFDFERRQTIFEELCPVCGRYYAIAGATPAYLLPGERVDPMEFVRTDIEFGTGDEQGPLLICGLKAGELLRDSGLAGFYLKEVTI